MSENRLIELEKNMHTMNHRVESLEQAHKDTPARLSRVEFALERLQGMEAKINEQGDMIKKGFTLTNGCIMGATAVWLIFQAGPEVLKFLGGR